MLHFLLANILVLKLKLQSWLGDASSCCCSVVDIVDQFIANRLHRQSMRVAVAAVWLILLIRLLQTDCIVNPIRLHSLTQSGFITCILDTFPICHCQVASLGLTDCFA
jgi:hypothetical protein